MLACLFKVLYLIDKVWVECGCVLDILYRNGNDFVVCGMYYKRTEYLKRCTTSFLLLGNLIKFFHLIKSPIMHFFSAIDVGEEKANSTFFSPCRVLCGFLLSPFSLQEENHLLCMQPSPSHDITQSKLRNNHIQCFCPRYCQV